MTSYRVQPDQTAWLSIPSAFPAPGFRTEMEWATAVAEDRVVDGTAAAVRTAVAEAALVLARTTPPLAGVSERFWWLPSLGRPAVVAHVSAVELDEPHRSAPLESFLQVGVGGMVQTLSTIDGTAFAEAIDGVLLVPAGDIVIALRRQLGRHDGMLVQIDVFVEDSAQLYDAESDITALFASVQLGG